ncbi:hypothetical protein DPMN_107858 [Dreissena polymorpha]|uniref:Uncharacterized protein n=1 Tax=Dreissena polymorpha TaxID=45954 RepID=A0A9D4K7U1_DREPO|nr:hypothetical protein DPMN_107858 [Dreissena polymorpha]
MARQRPTPTPRVEINRIVIREVQYQLEVNWCRNEEVIVKGNFGWAWPMWAGCPRIDRIVIRKVQYQFEVNRCRNEHIIVKGNFGWAWPMWAGHPRIDHIVIKEVQDGEIIVNGNFAWPWPMWAGRPRLGYGAMYKVQYQFEVNRCRNEEIIRGLCGRDAPVLVIGPCIAEIDRIVIRMVQYQFEGCPRVGNGLCIAEIDRIVIRKIQYQFEVNRCRNEEIIVKLQFWVGVAYIDRIVIREVRYQFEDNRSPTLITFDPGFQGSSAYSVGGDSGQDGRTDGQTDGQPDRRRR